MDFSQEALLQFFSNYAYDPVSVYTFLICLMTASSLGLPVPEEVTLISVGLVAYLSQNPELFPPPADASLSPINPINLAIVAFFAVLLSDLLIYGLGRYFGRGALRKRYIRRLINPRRIRKVEKWSQKYGAHTVLLFRFTPGLRFPGHLMCGMTKLSLTKFLCVDGIAALLTVPTQILLIAYYGGEILEILKSIKLGLAIVLVVILASYFFVRYKSRKVI